MMNLQAFLLLRQGMNLGLHIVTNPCTVIQIARGSPDKDKDNNCNKRVIVTLFFTGTKLLVLDVLLREEKFHQDHVVAAIVPELLKKNSNPKRRVDKKGTTRAQGQLHAS
jgi:hypothetical protein